MARLNPALPPSPRIEQQGPRARRQHNEAAMYDRMAMGFQSLEE